MKVEPKGHWNGWLQRASDPDGGVSGWALGILGYEESDMLHLELGAELEADLRQRAQVRGVSVEELVRAELLERAEGERKSFLEVLDILSGVGGEQVKERPAVESTYDRAMIYEERP